MRVKFIILIMLLMVCPMIAWPATLPAPADTESQRFEQAVIYIPGVYPAIMTPSTAVVPGGDQYYLYNYRFYYQKMPPISYTPVIPINKPKSSLAVAKEAALPISSFLKRLPAPHAAQLPPLELTLKDAILLALRNSPVIINSELQRIVDKFALIIARNQFQPHYTAGGSITYQNGVVPVYDVNTSISLMSTIGTQFQVQYSNALQGEVGGATITVTQPLLQGFGYVNRIPYENAMDEEIIARLNFKDSVINVVNSVINAYYALVQDFNNIEIQRKNLQQTIQALEQYRLQVKVGKMAGADLEQQEGNLASSKLSYIETKEQLQTDYQSFLSALGLVTTAKVQIDTHVETTSEMIPDENWAIKEALLNNIQYRSAILALRSTKRAVIQAQDARKPQLNVVSTTSVPNLGVINQLNAATEQAEISLNVPIDDVSNQGAVVDAKVAYEQAKINLAQQKQELIRQVITQIQTLNNTQQQIVIGRNAVSLAEVTLQNAQMKQRYGKATLFEVIQDQNALLSQRTELISDQINFLNGIAALNQTLGNTLDKWKIKLRY